jgi:[ribosomal protein S18]-alanine N-acetyltransferase
MSGRKLPALRLATFEDIAEIEALDGTCRLNPWGPEIYKGLILNDSCEVLVYVPERDVVGFCASRMARPELEILKIAVHPTRQGEGIGTVLLHRALESATGQGCSECYLEVRWNNQRAIAFYEKEGFAMVGLRRKYYRDPVEDARVMRKILLGAV